MKDKLNKDQVKETSSKSKKAHSKKEKNKKNILNGCLCSVYNNTIVSIADTNGNVSLGHPLVKGLRALENQLLMLLK